MIQKVVRKYRAGQEPRDVEYWRSKTPQERLEALELIRSEYISWKYGAQPGFQRVWRVVRSGEPHSDESPIENKSATGRAQDQADAENLR